MPARDAGIQQPRAVHVQVQLVARGDLANLGHASQWPDAAAAAVVRVFDDHDPRARIVHVLGPDHGFHMGRREDTVRAEDRADADAGQCRGPTALKVVAVRGVVADQLVARLGGRTDRDLVGHRPRRDEQGGLFAQEARHPLLQPVDSRVIAEHIVADLCRGDGRTHPCGRPRDGIAAQINRRHRGSPSSSWLSRSPACGPVQFPASWPALWRSRTSVPV